MMEHVSSQHALCCVCTHQTLMLISFRFILYRFKSESWHAVDTLHTVIFLFLNFGRMVKIVTQFERNEVRVLSSINVNTLSRFFSEFVNVQLGFMPSRPVGCDCAIRIIITLARRSLCGTHRTAVISLHLIER